MSCKAHQSVDKVTLHLKVKTLSGEGGMGTVLFLSGEHDEQFFEIPPGKHELQVEMPYLGLAPGTYTMSIKLKKALFILSMWLSLSGLRLIQTER